MPRFRPASPPLGRTVNGESASRNVPAERAGPKPRVVVDAGGSDPMTATPASRLAAGRVIEVDGTTYECRRLAEMHGTRPNPRQATTSAQLLFFYLATGGVDQSPASGESSK